MRSEAVRDRVQAVLMRCDLRHSLAIYCCSVNATGKVWLKRSITRLTASGEKLLLSAIPSWHVEQTTVIHQGIQQ